VRRENLIFRVTTQKLESVRKVSELCVTDIYSEFVKSFHIQRGREIGGARIFVLKAYNYHCPLCVITQYKQTTSES